jgi:hypothetical protein
MVDGRLRRLAQLTLGYETPRGRRPLLQERRRLRGVTDSPFRRDARHPTERVCGDRRARHRVHQRTGPAACRWFGLWIGLN